MSGSADDDRRGGPAGQIAVIVKAPVPGMVKTRLCPPYTPQQAAALAAAALADTVAAVSATPAARRVLLLDGVHPTPPGWSALRQRGDGLADRLANGYRDLGRSGLDTMVVAGDTPQLSPGLLTEALTRLRQPTADAVFGPTHDGGFWALGLRDPAHGAVLREVPMSTPATGALTLAVLRRHGVRVALLPVLRDVDTAEDASAVAATHPHTRFATAVVGSVTRHHLSELVDRRLEHGP